MGVELLKIAGQAKPAQGNRTFSRVSPIAGDIGAFPI